MNQAIKKVLFTFKGKAANDCIDKWSRRRKYTKYARQRFNRGQGTTKRILLHIQTNTYTYTGMYVCMRVYLYNYIYMHIHTFHKTVYSCVTLNSRCYCSTVIRLWVCKGKISLFANLWMNDWMTIRIVKKLQASSACFSIERMLALYSRDSIVKTQQQQQLIVWIDATRVHVYRSGISGKWFLKSF